MPLLACRVTLHCLSVYGTQARSSAAANDVSSGMEAGSSAPAAGTSDVNSSMLYSLQKAAVCRHFAQQLLAKKAEWELAEFMDAWEEKVPEVSSVECLPVVLLQQHLCIYSPSPSTAVVDDYRLCRRLQGMAPDLGMLRGEALILAGSNRLRRFPLSDLPAEAGPRFVALFAAQPKWEWGELEPYVQARTRLLEVTDGIARYGLHPRTLGRHAHICCNLPPLSAYRACNSRGRRPKRCCSSTRERARPSLLTQ